MKLKPTLPASGRKVSERSTAIDEALLAGGKVPDVAQEFGMSRSYIYQRRCVLVQSGMFFSGPKERKSDLHKEGAEKPFITKIPLKRLMASR